MLDVLAAPAEPGIGAAYLLHPIPIVHHGSMFPSETATPGIRVDMFSSEAVTRGVRVFVQAEYAPERSRPAENEWFFLYSVKISNESPEPVRLVTRHWVITDGTGRVEEVRGPGVVGQQPTLKPGESFEYTSGCPLSTRFGVMEGTYQMVSEAGDLFDARIAPFALSEPYTVH